MFAFDPDYSPVDEWDEVTPVMQPLPDIDVDVVVGPEGTPVPVLAADGIVEAFEKLAEVVANVFPGTCYFCDKVRPCKLTSASQAICGDCHNTLIPQ